MLLMQFWQMECLATMIGHVLLSCVKRLACMSEPFRLDHFLFVPMKYIFVECDCNEKRNLSSFWQHYSELPDIKRVIVNTHAIEPQVLSK